MSSTWIRFQAMAIGPVAAGAAIGMTCRDRPWPLEGHLERHHPPSEPPVTSASRSIPRASRSAHCARAWSRVVTSGNAEPYGRPVAGSSELGPVEP